MKTRLNAINCLKSLENFIKNRNEDKQESLLKSYPQQYLIYDITLLLLLYEHDGL